MGGRVEEALDQQLLHGRQRGAVVARGQQCGAQRPGAWVGSGAMQGPGTVPARAQRRRGGGAAGTDHGAHCRVCDVHALHHLRTTLVTSAKRTGRSDRKLGVPASLGVATGRQKGRVLGAWTAAEATG